MPEENTDLLLRVEAILFASGKPLSAREIADALAVDDPRAVGRAVALLERSYSARRSSLEVRKVGDRFALQLQEPFVPVVHAVTPVELAPRTVKALTLIAYHQPILQSVLVRMLGDVAYEEVQHLRGVGLVRTEPKGSTLELTTTRRFAEYFGIASTRPEEIRRFLEQKLHVEPTASPAAPDPSVAEPGPAAPVETAPPEDGAPRPDPAVG